MAYFTVIIPLYNKENHIKNTLKSVINQSFQDFEIIIIEDCSTDNSKKNAKEVKSEKIKILQHEKNKGLSASRNTGIKNSNSIYIAFLDADDIWHKDYLKKIHDLTITFPNNHLYATNYTEVYSSTVSVKPASILGDNKFEGLIDDFFETNLYQNIYCPSSLCVKKEVFDNLIYYNENINYGEDVDFNIRANTQYKLAYSNCILVDNIMYSENKITNSSLKNKVITDFDSYEPLAKQNKSLKKYLDLNRYMMASNYKKQNDIENWRKIKNGIDKNSAISGLNLKQRIILNLPPYLLRWITKLKFKLLQKGIRISSFKIL